MNAVTDAFDGDLTFGFVYAVKFLRVRDLEGGLVAVWVR